MPDIIEPKRFIPRLEGISDSKTRLEVISSIQAIYDYFDYRFKKESEALRSSLLNTNITEFAGGGLIADLGKRLLGSEVADDVIEEVGTGTGNVSSITITVPAYMTGGGTDNTDPVSFNLGFANQASLLFFASPTSGVGAVGFRAITHGDIATLDLLRTSSNADPALADLPNAGDTSIHRNTVSGNIFLAHNNAGVIVKVQLL